MTYTLPDHDFGGNVMTQPVLHVEPDDLRAAAHQLHDLAEQAESARRYAAEWLSPPASGGIILLDVAGKMNDLRSRLSEVYGELGVSVDRTAEAMASSAQLYESQNASTTEQFDRIRPDGGR